MPSIKPVSDLRSYTDVLADVGEGSPVFLTKNGRGKYAILDIRDYDGLMAAGSLAGELARGAGRGTRRVGCPRVTFAHTLRAAQRKM